MGIFPAATNTQTFVGTPAGTYIMTLRNVEIVESQFDDAGQFRWIFRIDQVISAVDEDAAEAKVGEEQWGFSSIGLGPNHKTRKWCEALLGRTLEDGEEPELEEMAGKRVVAVVEEYTRKSDGGTASKLVSIQPYKKARKAAPVATGEEPF